MLLASNQWRGSPFRQSVVKHSAWNLLCNYRWLLLSSRTGRPPIVDVEAKAPFIVRAAPFGDGSLVSNRLFCLYSSLAVFVLLLKGVFCFSHHRQQRSPNLLEHFFWAFLQGDTPTRWQNSSGFGEGKQYFNQYFPTDGSQHPEKLPKANMGGHEALKNLLQSKEIKSCSLLSLALQGQVLSVSLSKYIQMIR